MYGQVVTTPKNSSVSGPPSVAVKPHYENLSNNSTKQNTDAPVVPVRRKSSKFSQDSRHHDVAKATSKKCCVVKVNRQQNLYVVMIIWTN